MKYAKKKIKITDIYYNDYNDKSSVDSLQRTSICNVQIHSYEFETLN